MDRKEIAEKIALDQYCSDGETLNDARRRCASTYGSNAVHSERLFNYMVNNWFTPASPVIANAGRPKGLPISCFLNTVEDSREGILDHYTENGFLSSYGGGIGGNWSSIRSVGTLTSKGVKTTGLIPFVKVVDSEILAFSQGSSRRGAYAAYLDVSHPEIKEFISIRDPSGDPNRKTLNLHHGINITDDFMNAVVNDTEFNLVDPHTKTITDTLRARTIWQKIVENRLKTGEPYLHFIDTANRHLPFAMAQKGLRINNSNLCCEIELPTSEDRTAVCCLSSLNLAKYAEWCDNPLFVGDVVEFLDNVLQDFIDRAPENHFKKAIYSATMERSLGLGAMGFTTFLQQKMIPFDSVMAKVWNNKIFNDIEEKAEEKTRELALSRGECPDLPGSGRRNAHLLAIAPNATSSYICGGVSPGIEPILNSYTAKTKTLNFTCRNPALEAHVTDETLWRQIHSDNGSVQNTNLSDEIKEVFKTSFELNQEWVIEHAADRQQYIDQGQSINLFFTPQDDIKYINKVHMDAWKKGIKALYYVRTTSVGRPENIANKIEREIRVDSEPSGEDGCLSCEG